MKAIGAARVLVAKWVCAHRKDVAESKLRILAFHDLCVIMPTNAATDCQNSYSARRNQPLNGATHPVSLPKSSYYRSGKALFVPRETCGRPTRRRKSLKWLAEA